MIITVTLNAAIDKTLAVPNFRLGRRHRAVEQTSMAGGKGVNVARALKTLGQPVIATGVAGGPTGTRIIEQLTEEAILNDFVRIEPDVVDAVSTVGSGDAFLAGYVAARYAGNPPDECLRHAVASGAESVRHMGAGVIDPREAERLVDEVSVEVLSEPAIHSG